MEKIDSVDKNSQRQIDLINGFVHTGNVQSSFKSIDELREEVLTGQSSIYIDPKNEKMLLIEFKVVSVIVEHENQKLIEVFQLSHLNGIKRHRNTSSSVKEKIKKGEQPIDAVIRGLQEELVGDVDGQKIQIEGPFQATFLSKDVFFSTSQTNPRCNWIGVNSKMHVFQYKVVLDDTQYIPNSIHPHDPFLKRREFAYKKEAIKGRSRSSYFAWIDKK